MRSKSSPTEYAFNLLEHPSDIGVEAYGATLIQAFENAAAGLLSLLSEPHDIRLLHTRRVTLAAADIEGLLVKWLSEVLYLFDAEKFLTGKAIVRSISDMRLSAELRGEALDLTRHRLKLDVKAITYHQIAIEKHNETYLARFFVDI